MDRYLCIHCHFYQPPRENPWLELVEQQDSAFPYHDWNERITAECYAPNAASRILTSNNRITRIVNNYSRISFNVGPTLLSWMADRAPETYQAILEADRRSQQRFSGHGSAIAQVYNHMIMPLANQRDKQTQVIWGIRDFEQRFLRQPEGMWLAETAVDIPTLEALADNGIRFTVLAPSQAKSERRITTTRFKNVEGGKIDPTRPYTCNLPSGRSITLFFYDGPISRAVAFEGLLADGERFANRLISGFSDRRSWKQLMHIATDGETYGHHHFKGEMALTYALHHIESKKLAQLTNYGEYLTINPPTHEVEILENTAWSCSHGLGRWSFDCGCNSGAKPGWKQSWRAPLRTALDHLRDSLIVPFEQEASLLLRDPWLARDEYIAVVLDRSETTLDQFLDLHALRPLSEDEINTVLSLLEMQRHAMLMYTSCGWFFDELSGLETVQVIMYAGRTLQLAQRLFPDHHEKTFRELLASAPSNLPEYGNGARIFDRFVKPAQVDLLDVTAHHAIASMYHQSSDTDLSRAYEIRPLEDVRVDSGKAHLALGAVSVRSRITRRCREVCYGVLHFGDHNIMAGVREFTGKEEFALLISDIRTPFEESDLPGTVRLLDRHFPSSTYTLKSLFRDERQKIISSLLSSTMDEVEAAYRLIYERHAPIMGFISDMGAPLPRMLHFTAEFVLNTSLRQAFRAEELNVERIRSLIDTATRENIHWDSSWLNYTLSRRFARLADELALKPRATGRLHRFRIAVDLVKSLPFEVDLAHVQNVYFQLLQHVFPLVSQEDTRDSKAWTEEFLALGEKLSFVLDQK